MVSGAGPLTGQFCLECIFSFEALFPVGQSSLILFVIAGLLHYVLFQISRKPSKCCVDIHKNYYK